MISLASMNGPSMTMGLPSRNWTVVAVWGPMSSCPSTNLPRRKWSANHSPARAYAAATSGFFARSSSSIVPANNSTYFMTYLLPPTTNGKSSIRLGTGEFRLLLAEERHDADGGVRAQGGSREVLGLDLQRLVETDVPTAADGVLDHGDGKCRRFGEPAGQIVRPLPGTPQVAQRGRPTPQPRPPSPPGASTR